MALKTNIFLTGVFLFILNFNLFGQWTSSPSPTGGAVYCMASAGANMYAGTFAAGVFVSTNNGVNWSSKSTGIITNRVTSLYASGTNIYAITAGGEFFISTNSGNNWSQSSAGITSLNLYALSVSGSNIFISSYGGGAFLSTNGGSSWSAVNSGLPTANLWTVFADGASTFAGYTGGIYKSTNNGANWTSSGLSGEDVRVIYKSGSTIFAGADEGKLWATTDGGTTWSPRHISLTTRRITSLLSSGSKLFAGTEVDGIFMSTNGGTNWSSAGQPNGNVYAFSLIEYASSIFTSNGYGISKTTNDGATWLKSNEGISSLTIRYFTSSGSNLYTSIDPAGVFMSSNNGLTWVEKNGGFPNSPYCFAIGEAGGNLYTSVFIEGIYRSTNGGTNWVSVGLPGVTIGGFATIGSDIYAVGAVVYRSTNNGLNWAQFYTGGVGSMQGIYAAGSVLYVATQTTGVHVTTNNGLNWSNTNSGITSKNITAFTSIGSTVFAGTDTAGVFKTTNNGLNWSAVNTGLSNKNINALEKVGNSVVAATKTGVFYSTNFGESWLNFNQGINSGIEVLSLYNFNNITLYAGTKGQSLFKRPVSEITGIMGNTVNAAENYTLNQNYPNPFNPETRINFTLPKQTNVVLRVIDISGKEVAMLVNGELKNAGSYDVQFNGANFPSGIYFYELNAGEYKETKKMMLIK